MQVAGIRQFGEPVSLLEVPDPRPPADDEVLIAVEAAGVANWDDIVRRGGWDVGRQPPLALGVEAAGTVVAVGAAVTRWAPGDAVMTHPLPLRDQGTWAPLLLAPQTLLAPKPPGVGWEVAAAFPVPALTAQQVLERLAVTAGEHLVVHGAGGVTGGLIVALAALRGASIIATTGPASAARVRRLGAQRVVDYHDPTWPDQVRQAAGRDQIVAGVNAVPGGAATVLRVLPEGGRLVTITTDAPPAERRVTISTLYVRPAGQQLTELGRLLGDGRLALDVAARYPLTQAAAALAAAVAGQRGGAVVVGPRG